ncbi:hypothetical protein [Geothrix fuzhouensis]|uniref:hypothetical protein n=1 Tax=Geothrix fuzhouensis TaxID=2966451 RepID=UPI0021483A7D|nr:hypothetical protein [Geothrix fuzhouensis]
MEKPQNDISNSHILLGIITSAAITGIVSLVYFSLTNGPIRFEYNLDKLFIRIIANHLGLYLQSPYTANDLLTITCIRIIQFTVLCLAAVRSFDRKKYSLLIILIVLIALSIIPEPDHVGP